MTTAAQQAKQPEKSPRSGLVKSFFSFPEDDVPDRASVMAARGYVLDPVTGKWR